MLTICPTPIGNLDDLTTRQRDALLNADLIVCEDTRVTGKLLELLGVERESRPRLMSFHDHTPEAKLAEVIDIAREQHVVLACDAGTPSISDPGFELVRAASAEGIEIVSLPGAVAGIVGLVASGLPTDRFLFAGFLPSKSGARREALENLEGPTIVLYESPHRLVRLLEDVVKVFGAHRPVYVGRELTKMHEEHRRGRADELHAEFSARDKIRGECVVCIGPSARGPKEGETSVEARELVRILYEEGLSPKRIKAVGSRVLGISKSDVYAHLEAVRKEQGD